LCCFLPSAFVIARRHVTVKALVVGRFFCQSSVTATPTTAAAAPRLPPLPLPQPWLNFVYCQSNWQQQQHHQHTNGSTNLKTFTCPDDLDFFNIPTVFPTLGVCTTVSVNTTVSTICW
jgi:hypothetical protein